MPEPYRGESKASVKTHAEDVVASLWLAAVRVQQQRRECCAANENRNASVAVETGLR